MEINNPYKEGDLIVDERGKVFSVAKEDRTFTSQGLLRVKPVTFRKRGGMIIRDQERPIHIHLVKRFEK